MYSMHIKIGERSGLGRPLKSDRPERRGRRGSGAFRTRIKTTITFIRGHQSFSSDLIRTILTARWRKIVADLYGSLAGAMRPPGGDEKIRERTSKRGMRRHTGKTREGRREKSWGKRHRDATWLTLVYARKLSRQNELFAGGGCKRGCKALNFRLEKRISVYYFVPGERELYTRVLCAFRRESIKSSAAL